MKDRELLELAAKAAGYDVVFVHDNKIPMRRDVQNRKGMKVWNPLGDERDALRLAVRLKMEIDHNHPADPPWVSVRGCGLRWCFVEEFYDESERLARTMRAIALAAAEIGRAMP